MNKPSRRNFLKKSIAIPAAYTASRVGGVSMMNMALAAGAGLAPAAASAQAAQCGGGAKSLVCLFLAGGADSFNMFVPLGNGYGEYRATRNDLAVDENDLLGVSDARQGEFGFHRLLPSFQQLYTAGDMAVVSNVGPLLKPTVQADVGNIALLPQSLFAHNTQQKLWQNAAGNISGNGAFGWGGSMGVQLAQCNPNAKVSAMMSAAGSNTWQTSRDGRYIALSPNADIQRMYGYDPGVATWIPQSSRMATSVRLQKMLELASTQEQSLLLKEAGDVLSASKDVAQQLEETFDNFTQIDWQPDARNALERQLHLVARLIEARESLGMERQLFFVRMGGWDTHSNQNERLPLLMGELNSAVGNFQTALGAMNKTDSVTTFTASDFGRTLTSNGNGTDHGWGGHNFVFGGAVSGGQVIGDMPSYAKVGNPDDAVDDRGDFAGRIIPKQSVGQYGATLARWMGVQEESLTAMFPDLSNFGVQDLSFMG